MLNKFLFLLQNLTKIVNQIAKFMFLFMVLPIRYPHVQSELVQDHIRDPRHKIIVLCLTLFVNKHKARVFFLYLLIIL